MFGLSVATELFQGSTERTWNCVLHIVHLLWTKLNHIRQARMPRSRKRHHSRSKSRSRSHSRDRSHERDEKHKKNDSRDKDRDGKRRKIDSYDSPNHKRSVSSSPDSHDTREDCLSPQNKQEKIVPRDFSIDQVETIREDYIDDTNTNENDDASGSSKVEEIQNVCDSLSQEDKTTEINNSDNIASPNLDKKGSEENVHESSTIEVLSNSIIVLDDSDDKIELSKEGSTVASNLEISPKKLSSPKQMQKKLESEKKREQRQKEKEEKERKRQEEKERNRLEKLKKKEEKQKELEQKQKEKEMKEEQRRKEKEEREEQKRKEREEKEQKRKEKEEKEEQKRKEKEQEKLKKQQEIEEKNKEKQKEVELKQKTAAAFVNFFVPKKSDSLQEDKKGKVAELSAFMAFEVKSDMKLPPARRDPLSETEKDILERYIKDQDETASYIKDLKSGKEIGKSLKTWPFEECGDDDVTVVEEESNLGETICEDKSKLQNVKAKFLKFHENRRPAYFGTWRKKSSCVKPRKPFGVEAIFNYEEDSDDDWEEEEQGESLNGSDDEADKEIEDEKDDYEVDNEFFVPHGHLSDDEIDDEESARLSPESLKQKLKLLKDEFDQDMQSKTHKLKPRSIGCIWYNKDGSNVDEAINRYLQPLAIITNGQIQIKARSEIFPINHSSKKNKPLKELNPEHVPMFLKVIHGNSNRKGVLVEQFMTYMANNGFTVDISKAALLKNLKLLASWRKCKENGPLKNKFCWLVNEEMVERFNVSSTANELESDIKK